MTTTQITATTALCGHAGDGINPGCDPYERRTSVLDETGDVVLWHSCDGSRHLFRRDNVDDGLILDATDTGWTLTREVHTQTGVCGWDLIPDAAPVCAGGLDRDGSYAARHLASGRVIARHDTQYGLMAKAARFYLRPHKADRP